MQLTDIDRLFWALSFFGHCVLLAVLLLRRRATVLPVFTTLVSVNILRTIVLYRAFPVASKDQYFHLYWTFGTIDLVLQFALAFELSRRVFQPLGIWAQDVRRSLIGLSVISLLVAFSLTWLGSLPARTLRLAFIIRGSFFCSVLLSELFVVMIALSVTLGLPWRTHVARAAQGIGLYNFVGVLTDAAHSYFAAAIGNDTYRFLSRLQIAIYLVCLVYWIVTLSMKEPEPRKMPEQLHRELRALQTKAALMLESLRMMGSPS